MKKYIWMQVVVLWFGWLSTAQAEPLDQGDVSSVEKRQSKAEKDAEIAAAEAAEDAKKDDYARVIVLRWQGVSTDHRDLNLQRNVRSAIGKSDALFLPAIDLFQDGREVKDKTLSPEMQPAKVTEADIAEIMQVVQNAQRLDLNEVDPNSYLDLGKKYRKYAEKIWFVDRPETRQPLFMLYSEIGRVAEYLDGAMPPLYEYVGGQNVNYYYYLAANMVYYEPELLANVTDSLARNGIQFYVEKLQQGVFPSMKVDFQIDDDFNLGEFNDEYEVLINGLPMSVDSNGELDVFLGRSDILLKRTDAGFGLSDRYEAVKTEEKAYRVLENARKRMEIDFVRQLFLYENECKPEVDGDILTYLAIYAKLHPEVDKQIYIAVPKAGNPNKVWVWRFDPSSTALNLVESGNEEFPVHFVLSTGTGALYNGATMALDKPTPQEGVDASVTTPLDMVNVDMISANIPFVFDLRAHYTRFMVQVGIEFGMSLNEQGWTEYYQTELEDADGNPIKTLAVTNCDSAGVCVGSEVYDYADYSQNRYIGVGYLFGRDASFGYGLRAGARMGWSNMPHALVPTAHLGYTMPMDFYKVGKRIRPVIDADFRVGTVVATDKSLTRDLYDAYMEDHANDNNYTGAKPVAPIFGLTLSAGTTF